MSTTKNSVTLTFGYEDTDYTRKYKFDNVADEVLSDVKDGILAVNASLKADTAGGLESFFLDDTGEHAFKEIVAAQTDSVEEEIINLNV